jgi:hypothetical protein
MIKARKFLSLVLTLIMLFSVMPITDLGIVANATLLLPASGQCGDNVYWSFNESTGDLVISGTGDMWDYVDFDSPFFFYSESTIKNVEIQDGITHIGNDIFSGVDSITTATIPNSVTSIGRGAFFDCESLKQIDIPGNVTTIGDNAFGFCYRLKKINIPDSVTEIGVAAFSYCTDADELTISKNMKSISYCAFLGCSNLTEVVIPDNITCIENNSFSGCDNLMKVSIPDTITSIGDEAFINCESLTEITIPDSVTSIGNLAFYGCNSLQSINVDKNNQYYSSDSDGVLFNKDKTVLIQFPLGKIKDSYVIPQGITEIMGSAFFGCTNLKGIVFPEFITNINFVISGNNLKNITLTNSITTIESAVFFMCDTLTDVYFYGTEEDWNNIEIGEYNENLLNATIHFLGEAEEHEHSYKEYVTPPACKDQGYTTYVCGCGDKYVGDYTNAIGHSIIETSRTEPTCKKDGEAIHECQRIGCGYRSWTLLVKVKHKDDNGNYLCDYGCGYEFEKPAPDEPEVPDTPDVPDLPNTPEEPDEPDIPDEPAKPCTCKCHSNFIQRLIFKITNFFAKLFNPAKRICACGVKH